MRWGSHSPVRYGDPLRAVMDLLAGMRLGAVGRALDPDVSAAGVADSLPFLGVVEDGRSVDRVAEQVWSVRVQVWASGRSQVREVASRAESQLIAAEALPSGVVNIVPQAAYAAELDARTQLWVQTFTVHVTVCAMS